MTFKSKAHHMITKVNVLRNITNIVNTKIKYGDAKICSFILSFIQKDLQNITSIPSFNMK